MQQIDLDTRHIHICTDGSVRPADPGAASISQQEPGRVLVEPGSQVNLVLVRERLVRSSRHRGERHLDGDEVVYLLSGRAAVWMDREPGEETLPLKPGDCAVVPRGVWHRILIEEPGELLFLSPARTEVRTRRG